MIHSCSYYCDRPECIKAQRDELRDKLQRADDYAKLNPIGGPARIFDVMAQRIRAGENYDFVLDDYDLMRKPKEMK